MTNASPGGVGYLQVRVSTAQSALPLENVLVVIRSNADQGDEIVSTVVTDRSGLTPRIALPTVPRKMSEVPGNPHPFYTYHIEASKEGYYNQFYQNVPVFDEISAVQSVEMIPLPQNGYENGFTPDDNRFFEGENPDL